MIVVNFVDVFVNAPVMQSAMEKIVPGVFDQRASHHLSRQDVPTRHGIPVIRDAKILREVVCAANHGELRWKISFPLN